MVEGSEGEIDEGEGRNTPCRMKEMAYVLEASSLRNLLLIFTKVSSFAWIKIA
jgi:hypothetical protein